jgi:hypothetical protein
MLLVLLFKAPAASAYFALYQSAGASNGHCMAPLSGSAESVLNRNGIGIKGAPSSSELNALAKGLEQIERLRGGEALPKSWQTPFNYISTSGKSTWNQGPSAINVRRPSGSSKGENVTRLMHELGHKVGNAGVYAQYRNYIGKNRCRISPYCSEKHNEEFAEAFAAFVTMPDKLKDSCPEAYAFFSKRLFPKSDSAIASCKGPGEIVRESLSGQSSGASAPVRSQKRNRQNWQNVKSKPAKTKTLPRDEQNSVEFKWGAH